MKQIFGKAIYLMTLLCMLTIILSSLAFAEDIQYIDGSDQLFQCGSFEGPQTIGSELVLAETDPLYSLILTSLINKASSIDVYAYCKTAGEFSDIYYRVINDNPKLFYVNGRFSYYSNSGIVKSVKPFYLSYSDAQIAAFNDQVTYITTNIVTNEMTQAEKALAVHDYFVLNCGYNWYVAATIQQGEQLDQSKYSGDVYKAYGVLVNKDAVCQGYALAFNLIMKELGMNAYFVSANNHGWSMVQIDGCYYHVDVTWDDPTPNMEGFCRHKYFLCSDQEISSFDDTHQNWSNDLPKCISDTYMQNLLIDNALYSVYWRDNGLDEGFYFICWNNRELKLAHGRLMDSTPTTIDMNGIRFYQAYCCWRWNDEDLIYIKKNNNGKYQVFSYGLSNNESVILSEPFAFVQTAVSPYSSSNDYMGVRINAETSCAEAVSSTRREVLVSAALWSAFPSSWVYDQNADIQLCGIIKDGSDIRAGVYTKNGGAYKIIAAYYKNGRMIKACNVSNTQLQGKSWIMLENFYGVERIKLFCLDTYSAPCCGSTYLDLSKDA